MNRFGTIRANTPGNTASVLGPFVTEVTRRGDRLVFDRVHILVDADGVRVQAADAVRLCLDPGKIPLFSVHPQGGWVSPPYDETDDGLDCTLIRCRCHQSASEADLDSLETCGHAASCPKATAQKKGAEVATFAASPIEKYLGIEGKGLALPPPESPPAPDPDAPVSYLKVANFAPVTPAKESVPPGGLSTEQLDALSAELEGTGESIRAAMAGVGLERVPADEVTISKQLFMKFNFSKCSQCNTWGPLGDPASRRCGKC